VKENKRIMSGQVVSDKMDKTIVAKVTSFKKHKKYGSRFIASKKYKIHDSENSAKMGDIVEFIELRPISKDKKFKLHKIIKNEEINASSNDQNEILEDLKSNGEENDPNSN